VTTKKAFCSECGDFVWVGEDGGCGHPASSIGRGFDTQSSPMAYCSACGKRVFLCDDGLCQYEHPSSCLSNYVEKPLESPAPKSEATGIGASVQVQQTNSGSKVGANVMGGAGFVLAVIGFGGNTLWFLWLGWVSLSANWLNLLNPLFDLEIVFRWLFSWEFWVLLALALAGNWLMSRVGDRP
jgi:hypothetical protein